MIDFLLGCLDLVFYWFSSDNMLVVLPFCLMVFSVCVMFVLRFVGVKS